MANIVTLDHNIATSILITFFFDSYPIYANENNSK